MAQASGRLPGGRGSTGRRSARSSARAPRSVSTSEGRRRPTRSSDHHRGPAGARSARAGGRRCARAAPSADPGVARGGLAPHEDLPPAPGAGRRGVVQLALPLSPRPTAGSARRRSRSVSPTRRPGKPAEADLPRTSKSRSFKAFQEWLSLHPCAIRVRAVGAQLRPSHSSRMCSTSANAMRSPKNISRMLS
jgi:hypothetical protein